MRKQRSRLPDGDTSPLGGEGGPGREADPAGWGPRSPQLSGHLTRVDLELPDGRYLLSYGHQAPAADA